jgi:hypothetical protein
MKHGFCEKLTIKEGITMEKDKPESGASGGILNRIRMRFGEVAKRLGLVSSSDVENALVKQESGTFRRPIGEILVDEEKITADHVGEVLKVQKEWMLGAEVSSVKEVEHNSRKAAAKKPAKASTKKPAKKTVKKKTAKAAAKKTPKKTVKKKTAKAAAKKPAKKRSR